MKLYKKIQKAFGKGSGLYMDKTMLNHLGVLPGDEVLIEFTQDGLLIKKSNLDNERIERLLKSVKQTQARN